MKISNETTVRQYQFTNKELIDTLKIKGTVKSIKWENETLDIQTMEEKTPKNNPLSNLLDKVGNFKIGN